MSHLPLVVVKVTAANFDVALHFENPFKLSDKIGKLIHHRLLKLRFLFCVFTWKVGVFLVASGEIISRKYI